MEDHDEDVPRFYYDSGHTGKGPRHKHLPVSWQRMKAWKVSPRPVNLRPVAKRFEQIVLERHKNQFKELQDFPNRKENTPHHIAWELNETFTEYSHRYREPKPFTRKGKISIFWELRDPKRPGPIPIYWPHPRPKGYCLMMLVNTKNEQLNTTIRNIFRELASDIQVEE